MNHQMQMHLHQPDLCVTVPPITTVSGEPVTGEPVIGEWYLVPCAAPSSLVNAYVADLLPVYGTSHNDPELLHKDHKWREVFHFHIDWRFVSDTLLRRQFHCKQTNGTDRWGNPVLWRALHEVVWLRFSHDTNLAMQRRRCCRSMPAWADHHNGALTDYRVNHIVAKCETLNFGKCVDKTDPESPKCPHRGFPLAGLPMDENGCVICPGHGLRWHLDSGQMRPRCIPPGPTTTKGAC